MRNGRVWAVCLLAAAAAGTIFLASRPVPAALRGEIPFAETVPVAALEGEPRSPDGRFEARTVGESDTCVSGVRLPERLEIADTETGAVLWEDAGYPGQAVLWSPTGDFLALAQSARTWCQVRVVETETWTVWDFTLLDGGPIPEHTFLPEDWGKWLDGDTLRLTVGRGGDAGEQTTYRCSFRMEGVRLTGSVLEVTTEALPGTWDFDHDGEPETAEVVSVQSPENIAWYELHIRKADGSDLWMDSHFAPVHPGYNTVAACTVDGQDYLLRYQPGMWQGWAEYTYSLFSLDADGEEAPLRTGTVVFDTNFFRVGDQFDAASVADFLWEVHGYLKASTVLLTTEDGVFQTAVPGADLDYFPFGDLLALDSRADLEDAVREQEAQWKAEQGVL